MPASLCCWRFDRLELRQVWPFVYNSEGNSEGRHMDSGCRETDTNMLIQEKLEMRKVNYLV